MDKRISAALFIFLLPLNPLGLCAQTIRSLTLQQAIDLAALRNKEIQRSRVTQNIVQEDLNEQKEQLIPDIALHGSYARITDLTSFPTGFKNVVVDKTIPEWADLTATARLPLYQGGAIKNSIKRAGQELQISNLELEKVHDDIKIEVIANFLGIFKLMELQQLIRENIHEEQDRLREVKEFRKQGTVTTNEVLRAEVQLSETELMLLTNKHHINVALHQLQTLLQLPDEEQLQLDTANLLEQSMPMLKEKIAYMTMALQKDEMQIVSQQQALSKTDVRLAKSAFFPKISLIGSYGANFPNYMFFPPQANTYTLGKIGLEASWSISGLYKNKTKLHIAHLKEERVNVDAEILKNRVMDKVYTQYSQLQEMQEKLPVMESTQKQAAENYRIVKVKYLHQLALITDIIDADNALLKARFNVTATRIDTLMKHYELRYAAGIL